MQCPFLRKMNVKYCGLYTVKLIPLSGANTTPERCLSTAYHECPLVQARPDSVMGQERCPHLSVEDVHYCEVAPVRKLVPCNKAAVSRCSDDGHRYCDLYLSLAEPHGSPPSNSGADDSPELPLPDGLACAGNHMWIDDAGGRRQVHVGVDAFFARALGRVDGVSFAAPHDDARPSVRFHVHGLDLDLTFPLLLHDIDVNAHLAADPSAIWHDPYGRGWLFSGIVDSVDRQTAERGGGPNLMRGDNARCWLRREQDRLAHFLHSCLDERCAAGSGLMTDGGQLSGSLADLVDRRTLVRLHHEFFTIRDGGFSA
jgi:hypothetical protein